MAGSNIRDIAKKTRDQRIKDMIKDELAREEAEATSDLNKRVSPILIDAHNRRKERLAKEMDERLAAADRDAKMNPKDKAALDRVPISYLPPVGIIAGAAAARDGAIKYGPYNWREKPISYMGYLSAIQRHILQLIDRDNYASDSNVHHLGHVIATSSILLDAEAQGTLIDDRPPVDTGRGAAYFLEAYKVKS